MKIAIPMAGDKLCMHFGHCEQFAFVDVNDETKAIEKIETMTPPPHEPGVIPRWIAGSGANVALVGGMGPMAQKILTQMGVTVVAGAPVDTPENLAKAYLDGTLVCGMNVCNHEGEGHGHGHGHGNGNGCAH